MSFILPGLGDKQEEEDTGPSVDSEKQEERIEARRIRIQKRVEALRRLVIIWQHNQSSTHLHDLVIFMIYM